MAKIIFTETFRYRWPSRAVTRFQPREHPYTVRREVADAAIAAGKGFDPEDTDNADASPEDQPAGELARSDSGPDGAEPGLATSADVHIACWSDGPDSALPG